MKRDPLQGVSKSVQIVGIDCAAQDENFGPAYASGTTVEGVAAGVSDPAGWVVERVDWEQLLLLALDAPLGWPAAMGPALQAHEPGARMDVLPNRLFRRHPDRVVADVIGKHPLDIGADRIARTAHGSRRWILGEAFPARRDEDRSRTRSAFQVQRFQEIHHDHSMARKEVR